MTTPDSPSPDQSSHNKSPHNQSWPKLGDADIGARLPRELPKWSYSENALRRRFRTFGWKGTLMAVNAVGHLAEAAWHHPDLKVSYDAVEIHLSTHDEGGVTERDFALAAKIDAILDWRPGLENGPLPGTPDDARHGYLRYEDEA